MLVWLLGLLPITQAIRPGYNDFVQYYIAGTVSATRHWDLLYPTPIPNSPRNPGHDVDGWAKPDLLRLMEDRGVLGIGYNFIQTPPVALLLTPLGWLDFDDAHFAWVLVSCATAAMVILQFERIAWICFGRSTARPACCRSSWPSAPACIAAFES